MDALSWSRHHRLFPGEGAFDLDAGNRGPAQGLGLRYDRTPDGEFLHVYTRWLGRMFVELVQRVAAKHE